MSIQQSGNLVAGEAENTDPPQNVLINDKGLQTKKDSKCGNCNQLLKGNAKAVRCDICSIWFHSGCQELSPQLYKILTSDEGKKIHWYCRSCQSGTEFLFTHIAKIAKEQDIIKSDVIELKSQNKAIYNELISLKTDLDGKFVNIAKEHSKFDNIGTQIHELEDKINDFISCRESETETLPMLPRDFLIHRMAWEKDADEQYGRRENLRIYGIPENENENTNNIIIDLAEKLKVPISYHDISTSHRLGPKRHAPRDGNRPRPRAIIVKFVRRDVKT